MNKKNLIIVGLIISASALIYSRRSRNELPTGKMTEDANTTLGSSDSSEPLLGRPRIEISTSKGKITLELRPDLAPKTVTNFLAKWSRGDCDNLTFHRVEDWVVQGCDPAGNGTGGNTTLPTETSDAPFVAGSLGVARKSYPTDLSNDSQFFIVKKDSAFLNGDYTYFGQVTTGLDVVDSLSAGDKILETTILSK